MKFSLACNRSGALHIVALMVLVTATSLGVVPQGLAATIVIEVQAQGGDDVFTFSRDPGNFEVVSENGQGRQLLEGLSPGRHEVTTVAPSGWSVLGIMCHDPAARIDFATSRVIFELAEDDSVACTFIFRAN